LAASTESTTDVLYPMQQTLSKKDLFKLKGGLALWLASMAVPILLLFEFRYIIAGGYVAPQVTSWPAIAATVVLLISGLFTLGASWSAKKSNRPGILTNYNWALVLGVVAFILIGIPVCNGSLDPVSHYGETFLSTMGALDVYILFTWIGILATRSRVKRLGSRIENYWGVYATNIVWWFVIICWVVTWIQLYYL
jgi:heme/copper-type cytochrome/quinol oxidase subunit 3